ncbi:hypothetical protein XENOCAPTIV_002577 [Xenoophorus captivus]|uniref:Uncharacterized protein n=1 Tax=Xenoophorus captivus TaxID=1517983 RepID=A0ABV0RNU6_9TELE
MHFLLVNESPLNTRAKRDAVTGSHHSRGAAYSSAHKRTMRARSTQEIAAMQFTIVRQRWRTQSHTHSHTFIRTITRLLTHTRTFTGEHSGVGCFLPGSLNSSMRTLFSKVNSPSDFPLHVCLASVCQAVTVLRTSVCGGPSSFVWAQLRGESCFACASALRAGCLSPSLRHLDN